MLLLNKTAGFSLRAIIETLLNAKSCQRGPGLAVIVINNLLGEDQGLYFNTKNAALTNARVMPNDSARGWRPLCGSRIGRLRRAAAFRWSPTFGFRCGTHAHPLFQS